MYTLYKGGRVLLKNCVGKGWIFKLKFWEALRLMPRPIKASELAQAIHVAQWLSVTIPNFAEIRDRLDSVLGKHCNKPKKVLKEKGFSLKWTPDGIRSWNRFKDLLETSSRHNMQHYNDDKELVLLTDASKHYWSGVMVQIDPLSDDVKKLKLSNLRIEPLMYASWKFINAQVFWHVSQKELHTIVHCFFSFAFCCSIQRRPSI